MTTTRLRILETAAVLFVSSLLGCNSVGQPLQNGLAATASTQTLWDTPSPTLDSVSATMFSGLATNWAPVWATLASRGVKCDDGYFLEVPEVIDHTSNESWSIFTCSPQTKVSGTSQTPVAADFSKRYTEILKKDLSKRWRISHKDFIWSARPNAYLWAFAWSADKNYVYMIPETSPSGSGYSPYIFFLNSKVLYRTNLNSGKFETVLPYTSHLFYGYSLSPNGQLLAFSNPDEPKVVHLRDLVHGGETRISLTGNYVLTGAFVWKPDGTNVLFASALDGWDAGSAGISIFELTIPTMQLHTESYNDLRLLVPSSRWDGAEVSWADASHVYLVSLNQSKEYFLHEFVLDIRSGNAIAVATPTAWPSSTSTP